tara:strand:- start:300 stop:1106 length:807 start_codon:yes stop_codon:yes gene_type:complete
MILEIEYKTSYHFSYEVPMLIQQIKLYPTECKNQKIIKWSINSLEGELSEPFTDALGHKIHNIYINNAPRAQVISAKGVIETKNYFGVMDGLSEKVHPHCFLRQTDLTMPNKRITNLVKTKSKHKPDSINFCHQLNAAVGDSIIYESGSTSIETKATEAISIGNGVCQDFAHILIGLARHHSYPARYINGFSAHETNGANETHAWVEIYIKDLGWVAFDPSKKTCIDEKYVRVGCGFDFNDASMIKGVKCNFNGQESLGKDLRITLQQ